MMSDFMFPIYLATNKIQRSEGKQKGNRERSEGKQKGNRERTEGTTEDRNKRGPW